MHNNIDYNEIEIRLKLLYSVTDNYLNHESIGKPQIIDEEVEKSAGKTVLKITIGSQKFTDKEKLKAFNQINQMVDNLANLKDNTINALKSQGTSEKKSKSLVNGLINKSEELSILTDLDNKNKHGSPLTKFVRSNLDPEIKNVRTEIMNQLHFGWLNILSEGKVIIEADIVDKNNNIIMTYRELIHECINQWEAFYLKNLPTKSREIKERKIRADKWDKQYKDFANLESYVLTEIAKNENWKLMKPNSLIKGIYLKAFDKNTNKEFFRGVSITEIFSYNEVKNINIYNVFLFGNVRTIPVDDYKWIVFAPDDKSILLKVNTFYSKLEEMKKFASEGKFGN